MSHFNASETRRHIAFAQAEALRERMLEQYCALIIGAEPATTMAVEVTQPALASRSGWQAARRKMACWTGAT